MKNSMHVWLRLLLLFFTTLVINPLCCLSAMLTVGDDEPFTNIKAAIEAANAYDTILVKQGDYTEHSIVVNKPLTIMGENKPSIEPGADKTEIFIITADSVVVEGFVLKNVPVSFLKELAAIKVIRSRHGIIRNNEIKGCFFGIYLEYGKDYLIENNAITGAFEDEARAGNAIHVWKGDNIEIANNTATGHRDGIYFEFVDNSIIQGNKSYKNLRYGLHFMFSNNDQYLSNEFSSNGAGVAVMFSKNIIMRQNTFSKNWGGAAYGLLLKEISDGAITGNIFERNTIAILAEGANRLTMEQNQFTLNGTALEIKGNCLDNHITENNFLANTFEVITNSRHNNNEYDSNYWSEYKGYDLNRDGVGDVPYRPVNLFALITDKIPSATVMMHSFVVNLMQMVERIFPELIPEELIDRHPQMKPYPYD